VAKPKTLNKRIPSNLLRIRENFFLTQQMMGALTGVSGCTIKKMEDGIATMSVERIILFAASLGVSAVDIFPTLATRPPRPVYNGTRRNRRLPPKIESVAKALHYDTLVRNRGDGDGTPQES